MTDGGSIAVEMALLRGEMSTGFARIEGQLGQLVQSDARREQDLGKLDQRVTALEARRVPWPLVTAVSAAVSGVGVVIGMIAQ